MKARSQPKLKNMAQVHGNLVDRIVSDAPPVRPVSPVINQWLLWFALSLGVMGFFLMNFHLQDNAGKVFSQMPPLAFVLTAFIGAALAAWEAIASSVPGRQTGKAYRILAFLVLAVLVAFPFVFFYPAGEKFDLVEAFMNGGECAQRVSLVGILPWALLGWMLSRNASFHAGWTGAWSGASAFLLGTVTVQLHCPSWDARHILAAHLLPVALITFLTTFVGSFWFSRWRK